MARIEKYRSYEVGRMFLHNNRTQGDGVTHSNESIDDSRTIYNYHFKRGEARDVSKRTNELVRATERHDAVVMAEVIVTLPQDVKPEDERHFFSCVYDFFVGEFGDENIINAVVHKDERTPHIHIDFIPVVKGEPELKNGFKNLEEWKKNHPGQEVERLCAKEFLNRNYLLNLHPRLSKRVEDDLGYGVGILNGATSRGNRKVSQLKAESLAKEIEERKRILETLETDIRNMYLIASRYNLKEEDLGVLPLAERIADLENQNSILRDVINRENYVFSREQLKVLRDKRYIPAKSQKVNIFSGSFTKAQIGEEAILVFELYVKEGQERESEREPVRRFGGLGMDRPDRLGMGRSDGFSDFESPQKSFILADEDIVRCIKIAKNSPGAVSIRPSRQYPRTYIFIKTNGLEKDTIDALLEFERKLKDVYFGEESKSAGQKVYMDSIKSDTYLLAKQILTKNKIGCDFYIRADKEDDKPVKDLTRENKEI